MRRHALILVCLLLGALPADAYLSQPFVTPADLALKVAKAGDTMTGDLDMTGADITLGDNDQVCYGDAPDWCIDFDGTRMVGEAQVLNVGFAILNNGASTAGKFFEVNGGGLDTRMRVGSTGSNGIMEFNSGTNAASGLQFYENGALRGGILNDGDDGDQIEFGNASSSEIIAITQTHEVKFSSLVVNVPRAATMLLESYNRIRVLNVSIGVQGATGAVVMGDGTNSVIYAPTTVGTEVTFHGMSDANTVTFSEAPGNTGLKLNNNLAFIMGLDDNITFQYRPSGFWCEQGRIDN